MKISVKTLTYIAFLLLISQIAAGRGTWKRETDRAIALMTEESLFREISFLSDTLCKGRATGTTGNVDVAFWIRRKFAKAGLRCFGGSYGSHFITPTGAQCNRHASGSAEHAP